MSQIQSNDRVRPLVKGRQFQETCRHHAEMHSAVLFVSTPGVGKTQKAKALKDDPIIKEIMGVDEIRGFIIPSQQATEESINGFPLSDKSSTHPTVTYAIPKYCVDEPILLIIDDIGKAKEPVRNSLYPWLTGDEQINGHTLHPRSVIILLSNDVTHGTGCRELDNATKLRCADYDYEAETSEWIEDFAMPNVEAGKMGIEVVSYLKAFPDSLTIFDARSKTAGQPCPRKWEKVGKGLVTKASFDVKCRGFQSEIGLVEGTRFIEWLKDLTQLPTYEMVAGQANSIRIPDSLEEAYRLARFLLGIFGSSKTRFGQSEGADLVAGAALLTGRLAEGGFSEVAGWILRESMQLAAKRNGDVLLLTPTVGPILAAFPALAAFIANLGRVEAFR